MRARFLILLALPLLTVLQVAVAQEDPVLDQSREVLLYGIDSEVLELLDRLDDQGEERLDAELLTRFAESRNRELQARILGFFEERDVGIAAQAVTDLMLSDVQLDATFLRSAVRYLADVAEYRSSELLSRYEEIATGDDLVAASVAIGAIGSDGSDEAIDLLLKLYDDFRSADLKGAVVRALGDADAVQAVGLLTGLLTDPYEEASLRQYAAESLGKIGAPESLDPLVSVLADDNSLLRAYATAALGSYDDPSAEQALTSGLRDSFWRVRVAALQGIATRGRTNSLEAVVYKAEHDPEAPVRTEAIRTLAALGSDEAYNTLGEIARNTRTGPADRILASQLLVSGDPAGSARTISAVIDGEWAVEGSRVLDGAAKAIAEAGRAEFSDLYARLLSHPNYIIRIYAVRGIGNAGLEEFGPEIQRIARENPSGIVHTTATAALEKLGLPLTDEDGEDTPSADVSTEEAQDLWGQTGPD